MLVSSIGSARDVKATRRNRRLESLRRWAGRDCRAAGDAPKQPADTNHRQDYGQETKRQVGLVGDGKADPRDY